MVYLRQYKVYLMGVKPKINLHYSTTLFLNSDNMAVNIPLAYYLIYTYHN